MWTHAQGRTAEAGTPFSLDGHRTFGAALCCFVDVDANAGSYHGHIVSAFSTEPCFEALWRVMDGPTKVPVKVLIRLLPLRPDPLEYPEGVYVP